MSVVFDHEAVQELLGVFATNSIDDPDEVAAIERHLETCDRCRAELAEHLEALSLLTGDEPPTPSGEMWEAVSARITAADETGAKVIPLRRRLRGPVVVAAAIAASVLLTLWITSDGDTGQPERTAAIVPAATDGTVNGSVDVFAPDSPDGHLSITLRDVPDAPPGHHYEVWVLRPGEGTEMEPIGAFTPLDGQANLRLPLPGPGDYVAMDISVQENGGPPEHSGTSLAGATLA